MKFLPDGTVEIRNSKTGETKVITPNELGSYGISYDAYTKEREAFDRINQDTGTVSTKPNVKDASTLSAVENLMGNLEKHYQGGGGAKSDIGPLSRILGLVTGASAKLGLNDEAKLYENQKKGFAATLKTLTGDTGVLTDQDFERLSLLLPKLGSTQGEAVGAFNDVRSQVAAKFGGETKGTTFDPSVYEPPKTGNRVVDTLRGNDLVNFLFGNSLSVANDLGQGIKTGSVLPDVERVTQEANDLAQMALNEKDPEMKKQLMDQARRLYDESISMGNELSGGFSEKIDQNPFVRGFSSAGEIATAAEIPALLKSAIGIPGKIKDASGRVFSQKAGGNLRNTAVGLADDAGQRVNTQPLMQSIDDWAETARRAHPQSGKAIDKFVDGVKNQIGEGGLTPKEAFKLWDEASKGFTSAGTKGASLEASYHRTVRDVLRKEIDAVAPGFEQGTQMIKQGLGRSELAKKVLNQAGSTAVGGLTSLLLYKILFGGGNNKP